MGCLESRTPGGAADSCEISDMEPIQSMSMSCVVGGHCVVGRGVSSTSCSIDGLRATGEECAGVVKIFRGAEGLCAGSMTAISRGTVLLRESASTVSKLAASEVESCVDADGADAVFKPPPVARTRTSDIRAAHRTVTVTAVILLAADGYGSTVTVTVMPDSLG